MTLANWRSSGCNATQTDFRSQGNVARDLSGAVEDREQAWTPALDVVESDTEYLVQVDLPGMTMDAVTIGVMDGVLTISGERRPLHAVGPGRFGRFERGSGRFTRAIVVPRGFDQNAVRAHYRDGVLQVNLPKQKKDLPRPIQVK